MTDDAKLLRDYAKHGSEAAFGELVSRYVDLVHSTALRQVHGDAHLAQDVTQSVFIDLARRADVLPAGVVLGGWLYRHTGFTASKVVRSEQRRRIREQEAVNMNALHTQPNTDAAWRQVAPILDEAMQRLGARDRDAIVLRYFERRDLRAVGAALGTNEDAAQKRVSRALEKLRRFLTRRGVTLSATVLATAITSQAVTTAPTGLAVSVTGVALASVATCGGITLTLIKLMSMTKIKATFAGAIVAASLVTPLVIQHQAQARLRDHDALLQEQADQLARLQVDNEQLVNLLAQTTSPRSLSSDQFGELLRLRGEVGRLRRDRQELVQSTTAGSAAESDVLASAEKLWSERVNQLKRWLEENPSEKIPELQYLTDRDWIDFVYPHTFETPDEYSRAMRRVRANAEHRFQSTLHRALRQYAKDNNEQFPTELPQLKPYFKSPIEDAILQRYEIVPASDLVNELRAGGEWLITQKSPVNETLDIRVAIGLTNVLEADERVTNRWGPVR